jgi:hypothetical protein
VTKALPYLTVVIAAFAPLAGAIYLITSTGWSAAERHVFAARSARAAASQPETNALDAGPQARTRQAIDAAKTGRAAETRPETGGAKPVRSSRSQPQSGSAKAARPTSARRKPSGKTNGGAR